MNKHKKFIKDAYDGKLGLTMCSEWKEKIEREYPEFKKELQAGKWYKSKNRECLVYITKLIEGKNDFYAYGFSSSISKWYDDSNLWTDDLNNWTLATEKEVEEALIKEAKRRGYKEGNFYDLRDGGRWGFNVGSKNFEGFFFESKENALTLNCGVLFDNGKWAEIIEEAKKEMTVSEIEKELGYSIKIVKDE